MRAESRAEELLAELGRSREDFAAAERRVRTLLAKREILDQTQRDLGALLGESAETGNSDTAEGV